MFYKYKSNNKITTRTYQFISRGTHFIHKGNLPKNKSNHLKDKKTHRPIHRWNFCMKNEKSTRAFPLLNIEFLILIFNHSLLRFNFLQIDPWEIFPCLRHGKSVRGDNFFLVTLCVYPKLRNERMAYENT